MRWITRTHWLWAFFIPGWWVIPTIVVSVTIGLWLGSLGGMLGLLGIIGCLSIIFVAASQAWQIWQHWRSFSLSIGSGDKELLEERGLRVIAIRKISLGFIGCLTFQQTVMGRLLDYGTLSITSMGGPFEWQNLGDFHTICRIVESRGEWLPEQQVPVWKSATNFATRGWFLLARGALAVWIRCSEWSRQVVVTLERSWQRPSYRRFLWFAEQFVLMQESFRLENYSYPSSKRRHFRSGISQMEANLYLHILHTCRILITNHMGCECRHPRIHSLRDIQHRVSPDWFHMAVKSF